MKTQIKNWKKNISITALATTGLMASAAAMANDTPTSFAEQREAQMQVTRDRNRQILNDLNRIGNGGSLFPEDYVVASRDLLQKVESALTQLDSDIFSILSRFEAPIARYNEIAASPQIDDHQKAFLLQSVSQEIARLKAQASVDHQEAIKRVYNLIPGLPTQAEGSLLISNATRVQKAEYGCSDDTRHIFKAVFKHIGGEEMLTTHRCVRFSETSDAIPALAPVSEEVRAKFKSQLFSPLLARSCQTETCKVFLSLDYARVLQQLGSRIDQPQTVEFGRGSFRDQIPLANPAVSTWMVGASLVLNTMPEGCTAPTFSDAISNIHDSVPFYQYRSLGTATVLDSFRSRADLLVKGASHLLNALPVIGQIVYNIGDVDHNGGNSATWRANQEARTHARCDEELDSRYGGDRDHYSCHNAGWIRSGPRNRMKRERFYVTLKQHVGVDIMQSIDLYQAYFNVQMEKSRACMAH